MTGVKQMPRGQTNTIRNIFGRLILQENGCAEWPGAQRSKKGYGAVEYQGRLWFTHRLIFEHFVGPVPEGMQLDHLCRNPRCCNFSHLEVVTQAENLRRGNSPSAINARKARCPRGHPYSHRDKTGRLCRTCINERGKLRMRKVRAWKLEQARLRSE